MLMHPCTSAITWMYSYRHTVMVLDGLSLICTGSWSHLYSDTYDSQVQKNVKFLRCMPQHVHEPLILQIFCSLTITDNPNFYFSVASDGLHILSVQVYFTQWELIY